MPAIRGTASVADSRVRDKELKNKKFPASFKVKVDLKKVNYSVLTMWIEDKITALLGIDDEIVQQMAVNLFLPEQPAHGYYVAPPKEVDPKNAQLDLEGFLGAEDSATFVNELWDLMIDAQNQPKGIPKVLLEKKKAELARAKAASDIDKASLVVSPVQASMSAIERSEAEKLKLEALKRAEAARKALISQQHPQPSHNSNRSEQRTFDRYSDEKLSSRYQNDACNGRANRHNESRRRRSRSRSNERQNRYHSNERPYDYDRRYRSRSRSKERRYY